MEMAAKTWSGEWWKGGGGGTVWEGLSYDPESQPDLLRCWQWERVEPGISQFESGDNLFLSSIVAINADTGNYAWHFQARRERNGTSTPCSS